MSFRNNYTHDREVRCMGKKKTPFTPQKPTGEQYVPKKSHKTPSPVSEKAGTQPSLTADAGKNGPPSNNKK